MAETVFDELIGVRKEEKKDEYTAFLRTECGHTFMIHFYCQKDMAYFRTIISRIADESEALFSAMEGGDCWTWLHKPISPSENHSFAQKCMMWGMRILLKKPAMEPSFTIEDGVVTNRYI